MKLFSIVSTVLRNCYHIFTRPLIYLILGYIYIYRNLSQKIGGLYIYPHFNARSIRLRLPTTIFLFLFGIFGVTLTVLTVLSVNNLVLGFFETKAQYKNEQKKQIVKNYKILLKDYVVKHNQKETHIQDSIALLFDNNSRLNIGGRRNIDKKNAELIKEHSPSKATLSEDLDKVFAKFSDEDYIQFVDNHINRFDNLLNLIDKFEIHLSRQGKVAKSIPTTWPLRNIRNSQNIDFSIESITNSDDTLSVINDKKSSDKSLVIDIKQPMSIIASSRGTVENIQKKGNTWLIKVKHEFGFSSYYEGIEKLNVKEGDIVNRFSELGTIGEKTLKSTVTTPQFKSKNNSNLTYQPSLKYQIKIARKFTNPRSFLIFNY